MLQYDEVIHMAEKLIFDVNVNENLSQVLTNI